MKNKGRVESGKRIAEQRWGKRFLISIFPVKNGKHRIVVRYKDKENIFGGTDRTELLNKAFKLIENN